MTLIALGAPPGRSEGPARLRHQGLRKGVSEAMQSATRPARAAAFMLALGAVGARSQAQAIPALDPPEESVCLGFAFGAFTPKLDWAKAGHRPIRSGSGAERAPDGRDWASDRALPNDTTLYLFPSWWPVGVLVEVPSRRPAPGDTLSGRATALVASGKITPPVAPVRIWRVPCGRPAPRAAPAPPTSDTAGQRARQNN